jgi:dynein heavy chain
VRTFFAEHVSEVPINGANIHGLFLQGAKWDLSRKVLEDSDPKTPIVQFPVVWLEPVDIGENLEGGCFTCPLYKTSTRRGELSTTGHSTNFVRYLHLPSEVHADYWVRRGAALLAMTDD